MAVAEAVKNMEDDVEWPEDTTTLDDFARLVRNFGVTMTAIQRTLHLHELSKDPSTKKLARAPLDATLRIATVLCLLHI